MQHYNSAIPATEVAHVKRRLFGASKRIARLEQQKNELAEKVRAKGERVKPETEGGQTKFVAFTKAKLMDSRAKLITTKIELTHAKLDFNIEKKQYANAVSQNASVGRSSIKLRVATIKIPQVVDAVVKGLEAGRKNGSKKAVESLITISRSGIKADFAAKFDRTLSSVDADLVKLIGQDRKIKNTIMTKVLARLKSV